MRNGPSIQNNNAFLMVMGEGSRLEIHAADADKDSWTQLGRTASAGDTEIVVRGNAGWEVGDRIAIASTSFDPNEAEERVIRSVSVEANGNLRLGFNAPLEHTHFGRSQTYDNGKTGEEAQTWVAETRAEVALLSRNVTIQGDADSASDGYGGHTMIMDGAEMHVSGAEFANMGQEGVLGRYPIHWHLPGDVSGQYVENSSIHHSFNKGITVHGAQNAWIEDNVVFDTIGHGYLFEDGSEFGNTLKDNLGFVTRAAASLNEASHRSDFTGVSTYWIKNPQNHLIGNHAAGSENTGFWITHENEVSGQSAESGLYEGYSPKKRSSGVFEDNTAHSNGQNGLSHAQSINENTGRFTDSHYQGDFLIDGFTAYKNGDQAIWTRSTDGAVINDAVLVDNKSGLFLAGRHLVQDSLIVGRTENVTDEPDVASSQSSSFGSAVAPGARGNQFYDAPVSLDGVHFEGFIGEDDAALVHGGGFFRRSTNATENVTFGDDTSGANRVDFSPPARGVNSETTNSFTFGVVDVDGSLTGARGATLTPRLLDHFPGQGADIIEQGTTGFNALPDARLIEAQNMWVKRGNADIGIQRFNFEIGPRVNWTIERSDNDAKLLLNRDISKANKFTELLAIASEDVIYTIDYVDAPSSVIDYELRDVKKGASVIYEFKGVPGPVVVQGADRVDNMAQLRAADGTAFFRDGGSFFVKAVADIGQEQPMIDSRPIAGQNYSDQFKVHIRNTDGKTATGNKPPVDVAARAFDPYQLEAPDRPASTSDTVEHRGSDDRWSNPDAWQTRAPRDSDIVVIGEDDRVILNEDVTVKGMIINGGEVIVADRPGVALTADWVLVLNGGLFQAGTEDNPYQNDFDLTLTGDDRSNDVNVAALLQPRTPGVVHLADNNDGVPNPDGPDMPEPMPVINGDRQFGGDRDDNFTGTAFNDLIRGGAGNDTIGGGSGDDVVRGQGGDDQLVAGTGDDSLFGGKGNDLLFGISGRNVIEASSGDDTVTGGVDGDQIFGHSGDDSLAGGQGDDTLAGGSGNDTLEGGSGEDVYLDGYGADVLTDFQRGPDQFIFRTDGVVDVVNGFDSEDRLYFESLANITAEDIPNGGLMLYIDGVAEVLLETSRIRSLDDLENDRQLRTHADVPEVFADLLGV